MKSKTLPFILSLITLLILVACNTAGGIEPTVDLSVMTPEQAVITALVEYLEGQGAPVSQMNLELKTIAGDYARVEVVSTDPAVPGGFSAFMKRENGVWTTVVSGSGIEKEHIEALGIPRSVWPAGWLEQGDAPAVLGQPPITFSEDGCPVATVASQTHSLVDEARGFCLLYPASHTVEQLESGNTEIVLGSLMNHSDPRVSIVVEELAGRSLEQAVDEFLTGYEGFEIAQTPVIVGDEKAVQLDNVPGQDLYRKVMVAHNGFLYQLSFAPYDPSLAVTYARAEQLSKVVIDSFRFLEPDLNLDAPFETASEQGLCPNVPRPAVSIFIPGEGYLIIDPISGQKCYTTLDGDMPSLFQTVNGTVFYTVLQEEQFVVKRLDRDGTASLLSFTAVDRDEALLYHSFVVSPDGSRVAWSATSAGTDFAGPEVSTMWLADIDGAELVTLLSEERSSDEDRWTPVPVQFSEDNSTLFYTQQLVGMGGIWNAYIGRYDNLYALRLGIEAEPTLIFDCAGEQNRLCLGDFIELEGQVTTLAYVEGSSVVILSGAGAVLNTIVLEDDYVGYPTFGPTGELVFYGADLDEGPNASIMPLKGTIFRVAPPTAPNEVLASDPGLFFPRDWLDPAHVIVGYTGGNEDWGMAIVDLQGSLQIVDADPNGSFVGVLSQ